MAVPDPGGFDLQPQEEQKKDQPESREKLGHRINSHQLETALAYHKACHDIERDCWQRHPLRDKCKDEADH